MTSVGCPRMRIRGDEHLKFNNISLCRQLKARKLSNVMLNMETNMFKGIIWMDEVQTESCPC
jgi:hypothetical protein